MCFLQDTIEYMTVSVCVCVNFMKKLFSQSVSEPEFLFSIYNISTEQSKDDSHSDTAGDYVLNTLLVCYSRQPRLGLAPYSLFIVASPG